MCGTHFKYLFVLLLSKHYLGVHTVPEVGIMSFVLQVLRHCNTLKKEHHDNICALLTKNRASYQASVIPIYVPFRAHSYYF